MNTGALLFGFVSGAVSAAVMIMVIYVIHAEKK